MSSKKRTRPEFIIENCEDALYHDHHLGAKGDQPEYCGFVDKSWVFNRSMEWIRPDNETILCVSNGGNLPLTGEDMVSEWFSHPENTIAQSNTQLVFTKGDSGDNLACVTLPALQFNIEQHPTMKLNVSNATHPWQLVVIMKGRAGIPLLCSGWQEDKQSIEFDLASVLQERGYKNIHYHELFFTVGLWCDNIEEQGSISFEMNLHAETALVPCLPVIRTADVSQKKGVPVSAVAVDALGKRAGNKQTSVCAEIGDQKLLLKEQNGIWTGNIEGLGEGDYSLTLRAEGEVNAETSLHVRITNGEFYNYNASSHLPERNGVTNGPINGSYQGFAYFKNAGLKDEQMINGQDDFDNWDRDKYPGEHWHYWESMTEAELDKRFAYLAENGWDLLHLCQHWGVWEKLDAGGRIAPHGAEQVALYYRIAGRYGMSVIQALSHYSYGLIEWDTANIMTGTPPFRRYVDAGIKRDDWIYPDCKFTDLFHSYLQDYVTLFKEETALFAMTTSGEGDTATGVLRVNDTCRFVKSLDPNHLFLAEPIMFLETLPEKYIENWRPYSGFKHLNAAELAEKWEQPLFGTRIYHVGGSINPEIELGVEHKMYQTAPVYMAEGCWPCMHKYAYSTSGEKGFDGDGPWAGTLHFRNRVRDSLYIGLAHRMPITLHWDEQHTEDEHHIFKQICKAVNWQQQWMQPPVAVKVDEENLSKEGKKRLASWESAMAELPVMSLYVVPGKDVPENTVFTFDARDCAGEKTESPLLWNDELPDELVKYVPLQVKGTYKTWYSWSADKRTLLAYISNVGSHEEKMQSLGGRFHRVGKPSECNIRLLNMDAGTLQYKLFSLNEKKLIQTAEFKGNTDICVNSSDNDYFLLITPLD